MLTERLWLTQPRRATALAKVTAVHGDAFQLDRSLFAPTSKRQRHPQPEDRGIIWLGGDKRVLERVWEREGQLWHRLRGTVPAVGDPARLELDADRRRDLGRAHTAMHLVLKALWDRNAPALVKDPEVKLGRQFRLEFAAPIAPALLADALAQANLWVTANRPVGLEACPRDEAVHRLDRQRFEPADPWPGPAEVLWASRIDGIACYSCDGTHVDRTAQVGRIVLPQVGRKAAGTMVMGRAVDA